MQSLTFFFLLASAFSQEVTIDPEKLKEIFGTPPTTVEIVDKSQTQAPPVTQPGLETFTVRPTDSTTTFVDKNGVACKCVPYYLCTADLVGDQIRNASVTGWGELDIRFGEDNQCQESVEKCCTEPELVEEPVIPTTDPMTLKGCGYRNKNGVDFTIKGGTGRESQFGEFPWVAALIDDKNNSYAGVGVLIHPQVVMTAAHVAYKYPPHTLKVRAGEWDTQTFGERLKHQESLVKETYIHKDFSKNNLFNDVALLKLEKAFTLDHHINVICLPDQEESFDRSKNCVANGWGNDVFGKEGRYAVILKKLEIDMVPHQRCQELLRRTRLGHRFKLHQSFVCAGGEEGKDTCTGDGGAPLACPIDEDRYKLTGLVAWGIGCGGKDIPAVYARVPGFRRWIDDKMADWGYDTTKYSA